jgi:hypothetical protein
VQIADHGPEDFVHVARKRLPDASEISATAEVPALAGQDKGLGVA